MKLKTACLLAMSLAASPAFAMKVTNLDHVPHRVLLEAAGARQVQLIEPGATEYFPSQPAGYISLVTEQAPKRPSRGRYHADGILSGVVGEERNQGLPADSWDEFVIWPDGRLAIQGRKKVHQHL